MAAEFKVNRVSDRTNAWSHPKGGKNIDYWLAVEDNSGTELWVTTTRKADSPPPSPGEVIYGSTEEKTSKKGTKYLKLNREQRPDADVGGGTDRGGSAATPAQTASASPAADVSAPKGDAFWAQKDRRISRAGILQAVVASGKFNSTIAGYVDSVNALTDELMASLDERTPHPADVQTETWDFTDGAGI